MSYSALDICELVRACADLQNAEAWKEFVRRTRKLIAGVVLRTCTRCGEYSPDFADDLVQDVYLKLCDNKGRRLKEFQSRHPDAIYGYIKVLTANLVNDHFREVHTEKRGGGVAPEDVTAIQYPVASGKPGSAGAMERKVLLGEIERCLERHIQGETGERDRLIFRLYYFQGFSAKAISALPEIGLKTEEGVESAIFRITKCLRAELAGGTKSKEAAKAKTAASGEKGVCPEKPSLEGEDD